MAVSNDRIEEKQQKRESSRMSVSKEERKAIIEISNEVLNKLRYHRVEKDTMGNLNPVETGTFEEMAKRRMEEYKKKNNSFIFLAGREYQPKEFRGYFIKAQASLADGFVPKADDIVRLAVQERTGKEKMWFTSHRLYPNSVSSLSQYRQDVYRVEMTGTEIGERQYLLLPSKYMRKTKTGEHYISCPVSAVLELETKRKQGGKRQHVTVLQVESRLDLQRNATHIRPHFEKNR